MRNPFRIQIAPGAVWPKDGQRTNFAEFRWLRVHHRTPTATAGVACAIDGTIPAGDGLDWEIFGPGERRVRNTGGKNDAPRRQFQLLNLDPVNQVTLLVETSDEPIVDLEGDVRGPLANSLINAGLAGAVAVGDLSVFFVESTTPLAANATFTGPWRDCADFNWAAAYAVSDQSFTLFIDEADAATPNVINQVQSQASAAAPAGNNPGGQSARIVPTKTVLRFIRVRVLNGATLETRLNVQSSLSPLN